MATIITLASLAILGLVGLALTYFAYELSRPLLTFAGTVGGIVGGFVLGVGVAPQIFGSEPASIGIFALTLVLVLTGALFGYILVPALGRVAFSIAGFVATSIAGLIVLTQGAVMDALFAAVPESLAEANPVTMYERFISSPVFAEPRTQQALLLAVVLGFIGAALAMRYYDIVAGIGITGLGAAVMSIVTPLFVAALQGGTDLFAESTEIAPLWLLVFFATGLGFQFLRYGDEIDIGPLEASGKGPN